MSAKRKPNVAENYFMCTWQGLSLTGNRWRFIANANTHKYTHTRLSAANNRRLHKI